MFRNLLRVALRNFKRDKWYTLLNILGLTMGITFSLLLIFYIKDELSYDRQNEKVDRIYRISTINQEPDKEKRYWAISTAPLGAVLKNDFPEVEESVRFFGAGKKLLKNGDISLYEDKIFVVDSNVFKVFTYPFIEGDPSTALHNPNSIVLSESMAKKFFGRKNDVVGKSLQTDDGESLLITGVMKDVPKNSHIIPNALISVSTLGADFGNGWGGFGNFTYVLLKPGTNATQFEAKLLPLYDKFLAPLFAKSNIKMQFIPQLVTSIHLQSKMEFEPEEVGSLSYIYIFGAVAFFMLLIACINYMNLTTARSARRAKEIGIRKVTGSSKLQLVFQFLTESTLAAFFALVLSIILIFFLLPTFNEISGKSILFSSIWEPKFILILLAMILFVGLAGGSYPAFYLSKFNPIHILKGSLSKASGNAGLRRVLVVLQFSISMIMIICTWVVYNQLDFLSKKDLGFNKDQVVSLKLNVDQNLRSDISSFKNQLLSNPNIMSVATSTNQPGDVTQLNLYSVQTEEGNFKDQGLDNYAIDEDYLKTMDMKLVQGRNFSGPSDTLRSVIVNEQLVKFFNWKDPIGKRIKLPRDTSSFYFEVIGVVKDFNQKSLYNPISPLVLFYRPVSKRILARLTPGNISGTVQDIEKLWKRSFNGIPFVYTFLDNDFNSQYAADQKRGKIFTAFSVLTIFITCLGLLGLVAFTTEQRKKEISIRKIMGAGIKEIVPLVISNFLLMVLFSCIIAFPVAWLFMSKWLHMFSYNTGLSFTPFLLSALVVMTLTLLTVIFHALHAATANPVNSLRNE